VLPIFLQRRYGQIYQIVSVTFPSRFFPTGLFVCSAKVCEETSGGQAGAVSAPAHRHASIFLVYILSSRRKERYMDVLVSLVASK